MRRRLWLPVWVALLLGVAVAVTGGLVISYINTLNDDREAARRAADTRLDSLGKVSSEVERVRNDLEDSQGSLRKAKKRIRSLRGRLADRQRCPDNPRLVLSPSSGPVGTRVDFFGYCFVGFFKPGQDFLDWGYGLFIMNPAQDLSDPDVEPNGGPICELIAGTEPQELVVDRDGTARGFLTIPSSGGCFQEDHYEAVSPGTYDIGLKCHTCGPLARFEVTP
jgi:hypothetical protein